MMLAVVAPAQANDEMPVLRHPPVMTAEISIFGNPIIYKYGKRQWYLPPTGTGLSQIFEGVPEAQQLARRYQFWATTGSAASLAGALATSAGYWYRIQHRLPRSEHPGSWAVIATGATMWLGGQFLVAGSKRLIFRAVNVFNDRFEGGSVPLADLTVTSAREL